MLMTMLYYQGEVINIAIANITYMDSYINDGQKSTLSLKNIYDTMLVSNYTKDHIFRIPISDFFIKYRSQLSECIQYYTLPEMMFYKPKMLSLELYETTELWLSLLRVNDMRNITEFHLPLIKIYNPNDVKEIINIFFKREKKI